MPPTSQKEVRQFIIVVNSYRDMWEILSHMLVSLTKQHPVKWNLNRLKSKIYSFKEINQILVCNVLLGYPYFNEEFVIHTDASDF